MADDFFMSFNFGMVLSSPYPMGGKKLSPFS